MRRPYFVALKHSFLCISKRLIDLINASYTNLFLKSFFSRKFNNKSCKKCAGILEFYIVSILWLWLCCLSPCLLKLKSNKNIHDIFFVCIFHRFTHSFAEFSFLETAMNHKLWWILSTSKKKSYYYCFSCKKKNCHISSAQRRNWC